MQQLTELVTEGLQSRSGFGKDDFEGFEGCIVSAFGDGKIRWRSSLGSGCSGGESGEREGCNGEDGLERRHGE